jgi:hypothetical protein
MVRAKTARRDLQVACCTLARVLTIFTVPKPFRGHVGDIQRNAVESWRALRPDVQIILVGDEEGVEDAARAAGVEHAAGLAQNNRGTPRLDSAFECTARLARWRIWCLVNADIVLLDDFPRAVERVASAFSDFLIVGESRDLDVEGGAQLSDEAARSQLSTRGVERGRLRGYAALDYFVFPKGLLDPLPPFLIGRACFDNWLVWRARERGRPVVDVTRSIVAVHQTHDYSHVPGGLEESYYGEEARYNEQLAGGRQHIYSLHDATHRLYRYGPPVRYWGSILRTREKARVAKVSMDVHLAARRARKQELGRDQRPIRLLGVFPEASTETTVLLDALAENADVDLDVVYPATVPVTGAASMEIPRHVHWFARSARVAMVDRILGREYPVTWTIWHSFYFLRPDCMLISGWGTFPAQAAIVWCIAHRVPYLLLIDESDRGFLADGHGRLQRNLLGAVARRSASVLVKGSATATWVFAREVNCEGIREVRDGKVATGADVVDLARKAWEDSVRRRARRRRTRSAFLGRRRRPDTSYPPEGGARSPSS